MGLLDALNMTSQGGGGLLDFLRNNAMNQQFPAGLQSDQAQYGAPVMNAMAQMPPPVQPQTFAPATPERNPQPSPFENAQWPFGPIGAPSQANAQMSPAPAPAQPAPPLPIMGAQSLTPPESSGGLSGALTGFLQNLPGGPIGALIGAAGGAAGLQDPAVRVARQHANVTANFLRSHGVPEADIAAAVGDGRVPGNPEILKTLMANNVKDKQDYRPATPEERKAAGIPEGQPLFIETNTNKPTFGPANTNVNVSTEKTGQAELAKTSVEEYKGAQQAAKESQKRLGMYDAFEKAAAGFTPGATAEMRLTAKRYLKDAGLIKGEDVPDGEIQQMIGRQLAIHAQPKGQGAVSNYERQLYASSLPSMIQSPEGLRQAISINRKLEQFDQRVAEIWRNSARENKGLPNYLDVQDKIAALGSPLGDADMAAMQGGQSAPAASSSTPASSPTGGGWHPLPGGVKIRAK